MWEAKVTMAYATMLLTYVWHYLVARLLYDELVRPLEHGNGAAILLTAFLAIGLLAAATRLRRRRT